MSDDTRGVEPAAPAPEPAAAAAAPATPTAAAPATPTAAAPATPATPATPDASPEIIVKNLTWTKILVAVGGLVAGLGLIVYLLLQVVYGTIQERITTLTAKTEALETTFRTAITASISVQDLLARAPRFETNLGTLSVDVAGLKPQVENIQRDTTAIKDQLRTIQQLETQTQIELAKQTEQIREVQNLFTPHRSTPAADEPGRLSTTPSAPGGRHDR